MRYEKYKAFEYDWLPEIPAHWDSKQLRAYLSLADERKGDRKDLQLLSVYREYGVIPKNSRTDNKNHESEDTSKYKVVKNSDIVVNKMKLWQGSLGVSKYDGFVSPAYIVAHNRFDGNLDYLNRILRSPVFKTYYNRISYAIILLSRAFISSPKRLRMIHSLIKRRHSGCSAIMWNPINMQSSRRRASL